MSVLNIHHDHDTCHKEALERVSHLFLEYQNRLTAYGEFDFEVAGKLSPEALAIIEESLQIGLSGILLAEWKKS